MSLVSPAPSCEVGFVWDMISEQCSQRANTMSYRGGLVKWISMSFGLVVDDACRQIVMHSISKGWMI
jgi:hypothetical protein